MSQTYKVLRGVLGRVENGVNTLYKTGDFMELEDDAARALGPRVEPASGMSAEKEALVEEVVKEVMKEAETVKEVVEPEVVEEEVVEETVVEEEVEEEEVVEEDDLPYVDPAEYAYLSDLHWTAARDVIKTIDDRAHLLAAKKVEKSRPKPRNAVLGVIEAQLSKAT